MKRRISIAVILAVLALPVGYGFHLYLNYASIQSSVKERSAVQVQPVGDGRGLADAGVVAAVRREMSVRDRSYSLAWLIVDPATGRAYECTWEEGFPDFEKGDSVTLIHKPPELDLPDAASYVVGENHGKQGKVARVTPVELDAQDSPDGDR